MGTEKGKLIGVYKVRGHATTKRLKNDDFLLPHPIWRKPTRLPQFAPVAASLSLNYASPTEQRHAGNLVDKS